MFEIYQTMCDEWWTNGYCSHEHTKPAKQYDEARRRYLSSDDHLERIAIALGVKAGFYS